MASLTRFRELFIVPFRKGKKLTLLEKQFCTVLFIEKPDTGYKQKNWGVNFMKLMHCYSMFLLLLLLLSHLLSKLEQQSEQEKNANCLHVTFFTSLLKLPSSSGHNILFDFFSNLQTNDGFFWSHDLVAFYSFLS